MKRGEPPDWQQADPASGWWESLDQVGDADPTVERLKDEGVTDPESGAESPLSAHRDLNDIRSFAFFYECEGGGDSVRWKGDHLQFFGQGARMHDERFQEWDRMLRSIAEEEVAQRTFMKMTSSQRVFIVGFAANGTFWECSLDDPQDRWFGQWDMIGSKHANALRLATGPYQVGLLGSTATESLRGPEFGEADRLPHAFVWLTPLRAGESAHPGCWAQDLEWRSLLSRGLAIHFPAS